VAVVARWRASRYAGESNFHAGSPTHRTRKQRKRRGNRKESIRAKIAAAVERTKHHAQ
jgi:hypothetical protein